MSDTLLKRLLAIVGPTAVGKSALAVQAALRLGGEIINCDSMQLRRGLSIGTAKPQPEDRSAVPHHLYDHIDPHEYYSAGRYMKEARELARDIAGRGAVPIVVGGTGLYLRAFLQGVFQGPGTSSGWRRRLRRRARERPEGYLHRVLKRVDPVAAARIPPSDEVRLVRALEVYFQSGSPISHWQGLRTPLQGFTVLKIGLTIERPILYGRIDDRVSVMFRRGLVQEVKRLLEQGYSPDCKGFEALGYRHIVHLLEGRIDMQEAIDLTRRDSRRYAKRQLTWFRREPNLHWLRTTGDDSQAVPELMGLYADEESWSLPSQLAQS